MAGWNQPERIQETTRGRVVALLRRGGMTVDELAGALGLTDNAVRAHLATLERDGMVQVQGERREGRIGKPATVYIASPGADAVFSKAYIPLLTSLLSALGDRLTANELAALLADVGSRLAAGAAQPAGELSRRTEAAAELLNRLGGVASVEEVEPGKCYLIQGCGCPLGAVVKQRTEVCEAVVALLSTVAGANVRSCCKYGDRPSCCFEVRSSGETSGAARRTSWKLEEGPQ
jgi:predicted ArsR family transcriptional regulator